MKKSQELLVHVSYQVDPNAPPAWTRKKVLEFLEAFEEERAKLPWYKRWFYCIKDMIADLRELI